MAMPKSELFVVGPVMLSYTDGLTEKSAVEQGGTEKFSCNILFNESVRQQLATQVDAIGRQAFPELWDLANHGGLHHPIRNTGEKPVYAKQMEILGDRTFFASVSTQYEPTIVGPDRLPVPMIKDPMTGRKPVYGGCIAYLYLNAWSYSHPKGGRGVSLGLNTVLKYMDGPELIERGAVDVQAVFAQIPPPPAGAPQGQPAPQFQPQPAPQFQPQPAPGFQQAPQGQPQGYPQQAPQGQPQGYPQQAPQGYPQQAPQGQPGVPTFDPNNPNQ